MNPQPHRTEYPTFSARIQGPSTNSLIIYGKERNFRNRKTRPHNHHRRGMMAQKVTNSTRSALMGRVRQAGTATELPRQRLVRSLRHYLSSKRSQAPGSPDFANQARSSAVFVHGCFSHSHPGCKRATVPKSNEEFWQEKFATNRKRDQRAILDLRRSGYRVAIIWECEIVDENLVTAKLSKIIGPGGVFVGRAINH